MKEFITNISSDGKEVNNQISSLKFRFISHKEGKNETYVSLNENVVIFLLRGEINMTVGGFQRKLFDEGQVIFLPRFASCRISLGDDTLLMYTTFCKLKDQRSISFFDHLGIEYPSLYPAFPYIGMNQLFEDYVRSLYNFILLSDTCKCVLATEYDLLMNLSCCYERKELASLFSPIIHNKELIM